MDRVDIEYSAPVGPGKLNFSDIHRALVSEKCKSLAAAAGLVRREREQVRVVLSHLGQRESEGLIVR